MFLENMGMAGSGSIVQPVVFLIETRGRKFESHLEIGHDIISTVILSLLLI